MTLSSWFRSLRSTNRQTLKLGNRRHAPRCRLGMEALEDRTVPTVTLGTALSVGHELGSSTALDVAADAAGNSYVVGSFSYTTDFDPAHTLPGNADILTARGTTDGYIAKYAPDSSLIWVRRMGGDSNDAVNKIELDTNGNLYLAGGFSGSADFGTTTLVSSGGGDGFVTKFNASGAFQWTKRWGNTEDDSAKGIGVDSADNVFVLGFRQSSRSFDVMKFTANGSVSWSVNVATNGNIGGALTVDAAGNVYVGGDFNGRNVDFDPGPKSYLVSSSVSYISYSGFVLKLTPQGKFAWVSPFVGQGTTFETQSSSWVQSIALDGSGNVVVGGGYLGAVDFNPGAGTTILPTRGGFITKLNANGGLVWAKALESDNTTFVYGLAVDTAGSIYATGSFYGTVDFDSGAGTSSKTTAGGSDIFVMKLSSSGNFNWAESFGDTGNDIGYGIAVDPTGTIHLAGSYRGSVDFDPIDVYFLTNPGSYSNMFLVRLRQS